MIVSYWKGMFTQAKRKNEKLQQEIDELRAENRQLKDKLYGTKSEKKSSPDRSNQLEDPSQPDSRPKRSRGHQPNKPGPSRRDHSHLPVVEEPVELPRDQCLCPKCGKLREEMAETEDSELIEIDVRAFRPDILPLTDSDAYPPPDCVVRGLLSTSDRYPFPPPENCLCSLSAQLARKTD